MPISVDNNKKVIIDFESDLAFGHAKEIDGKGVFFGFDTDWSSEQREFEPIVLMYFSKPNEIDTLIASLKNAKKKFEQTKKHYPETDEKPNAR